MPLFEFTCRRCGRRFEALVSASRTPECPDCRSTDLEKLVSAIGACGTGHSTTSFGGFS